MRKITITCAVWVTALLASGSALAQWSPVDSGTTTLLRGVYLLDSGVGYAVGDGGTILKSADSGLTWSALTSGTTSTLYDVHFFDDSTGVTVGDGGLILRTTDGGANWQTITSGVRDALRSVSFSGDNGIIAGGSLDILYSSDAGASWQVAQKNLFATGFFGAHMLSPAVGFLTGQNAIFQGIFGSTIDGGAHWTFHTFYFNGNEANADDVFFFDGATGVTSGVLFDGTGAIARTTDVGTTWNSTIFGHALQGIDFPKPESGFAVGFFGTIIASNDLGLTWAAQESGTTFDLLDVRFASDGLTGLAVGANGTILRTTNGGGQGDGLQLLEAVSRKGHFDVDLPLTGAPGIECRSGGNAGSYVLALTFNNQLTAVDGMATSCGTITSSTINQSDTTQLLVSLAGVTCNAGNLSLIVTGVHDDGGNVLPSATVTMSLLLGDVNGDGIVDSADVRQTKRDRGKHTDVSNFREDMNTNDRIDGVDFSIVKAQVGTMLPPFGTPSMFVVDKSDNSVIKANLDGTDATDLGNIGGFLNNPTAIAINASAGKMYVCNVSGNSVTMSNLDGSSPVNLTLDGMLDGPVGIALDVPGNMMYVSLYFGPNVVVRANLDGSGAVGLGGFNGLVSGLLAQGMDIDVAGGKMDIAVNSGPEGQVGRIVQADLPDGANPVALDFGGMLNSDIPFDVKVDVAGNKMYVLDFRVGDLYRADLNGNGAVLLGFPGGPFADYLALDVVGSKMYISALNKLTQADLPDGANPMTLGIDSLGTPAGVAIYRP